MCFYNIREGVNKENWNALKWTIFILKKWVVTIVVDLTDTCIQNMIYTPLISTGSPDYKNSKHTIFF